MATLIIIAYIEGKKVEFPAETWFTASENPLYLGIISKPSPGLWEYLSRSRFVHVDRDGLSSEFVIPYRIEVGENSIFFLTPRN